MCLDQSSDLSSILGIVCGSDLENAKGTRNNNLEREIHHLSKPEKPLGPASSLRTSTSKLVLAPEGFNLGAAQRNRGLGGPLTLDALRARPSRDSVTLKWRVAGFAFDLLSHGVGLRAAHVDVRLSSRN